MKDHEVREFVNRLTKVSLEHAGCNSLRNAISREVKETLDSHSISKVDPQVCDCKGWGCMKCCSSMGEVRQRQGIFS